MNFHLDFCLFNKFREKPREFSPQPFRLEKFYVILCHTENSQIKYSLVLKTSYGNRFKISTDDAVPREKIRSIIFLLPDTPKKSFRDVHFQ